MLTYKRRPYHATKPSQFTGRPLGIGTVVYREQPNTGVIEQAFRAGRARVNSRHRIKV